MTNYEEGNSFTVTSTVAKTSSFALTGVFMSNFDFQINEESSETASQSYMDYMSDVYISGVHGIRKNEINDINMMLKHRYHFVQLDLF